MTELLLVHEPGEWFVTLTNEQVIVIAADGYSKMDGAYVFSVLMEGQPRYELHVVRIPEVLVAKVLGG